MRKKQIKSPVALNVFIRPQELSRVFSVVKKVQPEVLFLIGDGPRLGTEKDAEELEWWGVDKKDVIGRLLVFSADDNSIPFELFEDIEEEFDARRLHLG